MEMPVLLCARARLCESTADAASHEFGRQRCAHFRHRPLAQSVTAPSPALPQKVGEIDACDGEDQQSRAQDGQRSGDSDCYGVELERGRSPEEAGCALRYAVTPGYLETMGIPLRRGRLLDARDGSARPRCC